MNEVTRAAVRGWVDQARERDKLVRLTGELLQNGADERAWAELRKRALFTATRHPSAEGRTQARALADLLKKKRSPWRAIAVAGVVGLVAVALGVLRVVLAPSLHVSITTRDTIGPGQLVKLAFVEPGGAGKLERQRWMLDGKNVTDRVKTSGTTLVFRPMELFADGRHALVVAGRRGFLGTRARTRVAFSVDLTAPKIRLDRTPVTHQWQPATLSGSVDDSSARLTVGGRPVQLDDGRFSVSLQPPFDHSVALVAVDGIGNKRVDRISVKLVPRTPPAPVRAVHVTADAWANPALHAGVMKLVAQHRITAVELDLKDEGGLVGFDPSIPLARRIGAAEPIYDLAAAVRTLHAHGIRVIGRLVCFRDPILASAAWKEGRRDEVVQTPGGQPYSGYGGFTNLASPAVRDYQIAIAVAAARAGVDDVLYDYVRRPDGPLSTMVFPGLKGSPAKAIVEFLRETRLALRPYGTYLGASVFGIAATRPDQIAQDVPAIARQVDYVAPMVYPSHWNKGEYGVADPNAQPYQIVERALTDFRREVAGTGARLVPWLQDFSLGVTYGPKQVRAQIDAAAALGIHEFLLWDPAVTYDGAALDVKPQAQP